ncbi:[protein-PII] uridylyltransferase [Streptomyces sp. AV19]|uniref:[protein-PII] uridylyltransferase n=1 Tax=Streptomyces sp. AV19 TaxID=2793068 RepID=UPI0018FE45F1|nr:[protein-PII] uridylyltransferase [Streptomyces sp. AV19]MBH1933988.1 [protein-PII] uridylyltransferase [Streptomyces sp. AV19]MDG4535528.1 [protein-PII] uridylyltransferase [Streptomyces sp. AV19]
MTHTGLRATDTAPDAGGYAAARLRLLGGAAPAGPALRTALARLTDEWLGALLGRAHGVALVAVGGYGRGELSPRSDLDLLLLHHPTADPGHVAAVADRVWYPVWDMGLALDHAVRTPAGARATAGDDLKVHLGLLDARHLAGDPALTTALRTTAYADWRAQAPRRLPELRELCEERARRQGELRFLLEPDLKEARGGLRDATALRAVAASWLADAPRQGLDEARILLLDTRDALHRTTGRATDRLTLQEQDQVAAALGLPDADTLLRRVYRAAATVSHSGDATWREVGRVLRSRSGRPRLRRVLGGRGGRGGFVEPERVPLAEGVVEQDGEAVLARTARPDRDPVLPLRAAAAAARAGLPLATHTVRRLRGAGPLPEPWPAEAREQFVTLLGAGEPTVAAWEALEAEGLVSRLLPEWERVRHRPQRNAVHRWTVDRHLVETCVRAAALARRVARPDLLLVAALLHDIGKGHDQGDHSVTGAAVARDVTLRIGFGDGDASVVATLVRHHLLLVETATRRDLDDPATVRAVTDAVADAETLELLHALTEADALATGPAAWSAWRASLVADLVRRAAAVLAGEPAAERAVPPPPTPAQERLAARTLASGGLAVELSAGADGAELLLAVPDQPGVLPAAAGVLALHRLAVRTADLRAVDGSVLLLRWRVAAEYGELPEAARLRNDLVRALDGSLDVAGRLAEREAAYAGTGTGAGRRRGTVPPPSVTVAEGGSRSATVLEVRAEDGPGLLHRIGRALEGAGVWVRSAYVSTLGGSVVDAFYVTGVGGEPLGESAAGEVAGAVERALVG